VIFIEFKKGDPWNLRPQDDKESESRGNSWIALTHCTLRLIISHFAAGEESPTFTQFLTRRIFKNSHRMNIN